MSRFNELWYTTGSDSGRLPAGSPMREALSRTLPTSSGTDRTHQKQRITRGIRDMVTKFGALNDVAITTGRAFEDVKLALDALNAAHGDRVFQEPANCVFCPDVGDRVQHHFDTAYLAGVPIWTRVCERHEDQPLCPKTPDGFHDEFVAASDDDFQIELTTVVDVDRLEECGHCSRCGLPLVKDPSFKVRYEDEGWRYWTPEERGRIIAC